MSGFPDPDDPKERFLTNKCNDCGKRRKLDGRNDLDYWLGYAYEEGYVGEISYAWLRHEHDWYCVECAKEFFGIEEWRERKKEVLNSE